MAGKPLVMQPDAASQQYNWKDEKDENDIRMNQGNTKGDIPKKKTTFKITSVTKSAQRGGSGDLILDNEDDLDETIDSHTEDFSSEMYDTNSRATDIDNQESPLTPEEVVKETEPKEKSARFKVVKLESKKPFKRGRWVCWDYLDTPEKTEVKPEEIQVKSGTSSTTNSVHYVHGVDDPSKNPLLAGATGTMPSQSVHPPTTGQDAASNLNTYHERFQPVQHTPSSQPSLIPSSHINSSVSQLNSSFSNQFAQSSASLPYPAQGGLPAQSLGQSVPAASSQPLRTRDSVPNLPSLQQGQTHTSQSLSGNIPYPNSLPGATVPSSSHSQPASVMSSVNASQPTPRNTGDYGNSSQSQVNGSHTHQVPTQQQGMYSMSSQKPSYTNTPMPASVPAKPVDGYGSDEPQSSLSGTALSSLAQPTTDGGGDSRPGLGAGLVPLKIAVGGITNASSSDDAISDDM